LGNFDVNVLLVALARRGLEAAWHDVRKTLTARELQGAVGLLANMPSTPSPWGQAILKRVGAGNHWYTVRNVGGTWWDLNSSLAAPLQFKSVDALLEAMAALLAGGGNVIVIKPMPPDAAGAEGAAGSGGASVVDSVAPAQHTSSAAADTPARVSLSIP
jgi:hypothetical protein